MKAAIFYGKKDIRIQELEEPKVRPGYATIKIKCCGICGSDLHEYVGGPIFISKDPHPLTGEKAPLIIGHEFVGEVIEVGPDVKRIKMGDRVAVDSFIYCGQCPNCKRGDYRLCNMIGVNGFSGITSGFAQYTIAPEYQLYKLPANLSYEAGALADPISVGLHALRKGEMLPGKKVGIFGAGPIGLSILQVARASGASLIAASEVSQIRRDFAQKCGANLILNPGEQKNISELILEATEGDGLDIAFECAGVAPSLMDAIRSTRKGGIIVVVSAFEKPVSLNLLETWFTEKRIDFCFGYKNDFSGALALMADRRVNGEVMITKKISLTDLVAEGFEELILNSEKNIKIMVYPN